MSVGVSGAQASGGNSAASGAAQQAGSGQPSSNQQRGRTVDGGGATGGGADSFDYKSAFTGQTKKIQELESRTGLMHKELEGAKGDRQLLSKLREVFNPEQQNQATYDPVPEWESQLDFYIEQAVEAKNNGRGIPLTAN